MKDKLQKAFVLFVIGALSGLSIWAVNLATVDQIALNIKEKEDGYYKEIFDIDLSVEITTEEIEVEDGLFEVEIMTGSEEDGFTTVGYAYKGSKKNNYGDITVLVGIEDSKIKAVIISDTSNTPNFVKKIEKEYLHQFVEQMTSNVSFDTKTGASYTYGSVTEVVTESVTYYNTERGAE